MRHLENVTSGSEKKMHLIPDSNATTQNETNEKFHFQLKVLLGVMH